MAAVDRALIVQRRAPRIAPRLLWTAAATLAWLPASVAQTSPTRVGIDIQLTAEPDARCPLQPTLRERVQTCSAEPLDDWPWVGVRAKVRVLTRDAAVQGRIILWVGDRAALERPFRQQRACEELLAAAALSICIALDALATRELAHAPGRRDTTTGPRRDRRGPVFSGPQRTPHTRLGFSLLGSYGFSPALSAGVALSVMAPRGPWLAGLVARIDAPFTTELAGGRVGAAAMLGGVIACFEQRRLQGCALLYAGARRMFGVDLPGGDSGGWLIHIRPAARVAWHLGTVRGVATTLWLQAERAAEARELSAQIGVVKRDANGPVTDPATGLPVIGRTETIWTAPPLGFAVGIGFHRDD